MATNKQRACNLLIELQALKEVNTEENKLGMQYLLEVVLKDAEKLAMGFLLEESQKNLPNS